MKKKLVLLAILFILSVVNVFELIYYGLILDFAASGTANKLCVILTLLSFLMVVIAFIYLMYCIIMNIDKAKIIKYAACIVLVLNCVIAACFIVEIKEYSKTSSEYETEDYIESDYFYGMSLEELKTDLSSSVFGDELIIYIGRSDCGECSEFEEAIIPYLEEYNFELATYYTNQDRDTENASEMYDLLGEYEITSVPTVVVVKNGEIIQIWDNPTEAVLEITRYM